MPLTEINEVALHHSTIAEGLESDGWMLIDGFLATERYGALASRASALEDYRLAGIGRGDDLALDKRVRGDRIHWLEPGHPVDRQWLDLMEQLRTALNRTLFLGLFEYESHYARYHPGAFYQRHVDAFKGEGNRRVSTVFYLNESWVEGDGGELVIYPPGGGAKVVIAPRGGTLVVFLSEDFAHEVLPCRKDRFSIAGWFRVNGSDSTRLDPPR